MAVTADKVVTILEAKTADYDRRIARSEALFTRSMNSIQKSAGIARAAIGGIFAGIVAGGGAQAARQLIDSSIRIENALKTAGLEGRELKKVYDQLFVSAQKNAVPIESLAGLYGKLALNQKELGVSSEQLVNFTDTIGKALRAGGTDATAASGALLQLSQALGGGVVRAEEFNSVLEGAPGIVQAAAAGIAEAGGSVSKLRQLMIDGKVSSKAFFDGIEAGAPVLDKRLANAEGTVSAAFVRLRNVLTDTARDFNKSTKAAEVFGGVLDGLATWIQNADFNNLITEIQQVIDRFNQGVKSARDFFTWLGRISGADNIGEIMAGGSGYGSIGGDFTNPWFSVTSQKGIQNRIDGAFGDVVETTGELTENAIRDAARRRGVPTTTAGGKTGRLPAAETVKPISLSDYSLGGTGGGAGGGSAKKVADAAKAEADKLASAIAAQASIAVDAATNLLGQHENLNQGNINSFLKAGGVDLDAATTAWCAAFVNSALAQVGIKGSGSNVATDFLNWGSGVGHANIQRGDVLVQPRGLGAGQAGGHVGFATGNLRATAEGISQIEMISGNAANKVQTQWVNATGVVARRATEGFAIATDSLAHLTAQTDAATTSTQNLTAAEQAFGQIAQTAIQGLTTALADGKIEAEELLQILLQIVQQMLTMPTGAGGGGGFLSSLLGGLFRERGGPVKKGQPYIVGEKRPELFIPDQGGRIMPRVPNIAMPTRSTPTAGGFITTRVISEVVNGNLIPTMTEVSGIVGGAQIRQANKRMPARISVSQARGV